MDHNVLTGSSTNVITVVVAAAVAEAVVVAVAATTTAVAAAGEKRGILRSWTPMELALWTVHIAASVVAENAHPRVAVSVASDAAAASAADGARPSLANAALSGGVVCA